MAVPDPGIINECRIKAVLSGGKGGQHANKVSTAVELTFSIPNSELLSGEEKGRLLKKLSAKISSKGVLRIVASVQRSQYLNRKEAISRFMEIISDALTEPKKRKKIKTTAASHQTRLQSKRLRSELKKLRKRPEGF